MNSDPCDIRARLCICVDDFGLDDGVNEAVQALAARGRVQATSCMVFAPAWKSGAAALRPLEGRPLDVGLHLDFTQHPSRPDRRQPLRSLILKSTLGLLDTSMIRSEIRAQFDAFEQAMGRQPDHVDGHQHIHQLPGIRDELIAEIRQRYGQSAPWLRMSRGLPCLPAGRATGWRTAAKSGVITALGSGPLRKLARATGLAGNRRLLGIHGFSPDDAIYRRLLDTWMSVAQDGDLLMCHPSTQAISEDPIAAARLTEFNVFSDEHAFDAIVAAHGIGLMPMSRILRDSP